MKGLRSECESSECECTNCHTVTCTTDVFTFEFLCLSLHTALCSVPWTRMNAGLITMTFHTRTTASKRRRLLLSFAEVDMRRFRLLNMRRCSCKSWNLNHEIARISYLQKRGVFCSCEEKAVSVCSTLYSFVRTHMTEPSRLTAQLRPTEKPGV